MIERLTPGHATVLADAELDQVSGGQAATVTGTPTATNPGAPSVISVVRHPADGPGHVHHAVEPAVP